MLSQDRFTARHICNCSLCINIAVCTLTLTSHVSTKLSCFISYSFRHRTPSFHSCEFLFYLTCVYEQVVINLFHFLGTVNHLQFIQYYSYSPYLVVISYFCLTAEWNLVIREARVKSADTKNNFISMDQTSMLMLMLMLMLLDRSSSFASLTRPSLSKPCFRYQPWYGQSRLRLTARFIRPDLRMTTS